MGFQSSTGQARSRAPGSTPQQDAHPHQAGVNQAPLKRKRTLSKFYFAKSQSFNCMSDLLKGSAFSTSSLLLAKRSSSSSSDSSACADSCPSISEDASECTSPRGRCLAASTAFAVAVAVPLQQSHSAAARCCSLERRSWDCSSSEPSCSMGGPSLPAVLDQNFRQHVQQQQQQQLGVCSSLASRCGSCSLELAAGDDADCCWADAEVDGSATDGLCMALQTTSLAAAAAAPQQCMFAAGGSGGGSIHGCCMAEG